MKRLLLAFQFLTIIPLKNIDKVSGKDMGGASGYFPLVGAVHGILLVISSILFLRIFSAQVSNVLVILLNVIINGGLHLDGFADTFDAIASRKGKEKKLAVMKDSFVGPFGVMAIVFAILLKYLFLNEVFSISLYTYYPALFLMPLFSRWAMVTAIFHGKPARVGGLGRTFIENTGLKEFMTATFLTLILFLLAVFSIFNTPRSAHVIFFMPVLYTSSRIAVWFCNKTFGGMTGDTFGAVSELSEIIFLMSVIIWP